MATSQVTGLSRGAYVDRWWIESRIVCIAKAALHGRPGYRKPGKNGAPDSDEPPLDRNHPLALNALMQLARLKGLVVERKTSLQGKIDLSKLSATELQAMLSGQLDQLDPAARAQIESIAAGEYDVEADPID